jgi:hypothetical protein
MNFFWREACIVAGVPISAIAARPSSGPIALNGQQGRDSGESFEPVWSSPSKQAPAKQTTVKEDPSDSGAPKTKSAKRPSPTAKESDSAPVAVADSTAKPVDPPLVLKTSEKQFREAGTTAPQAPVVEVFTLPQAVPAPDPTPAADAGAPSTDAASVDASSSGVQAPIDPGSLVFRLFLNSPEGSGKPTAADHRADASETHEFPAPEEVSAQQEARAGGANQDAKNQDQDQPQQQPLPAGADTTIASQFGFHSPLSFAAHMPAAKVEAPAAPARTAEINSAPDLPVASSVDRIALTLRSADDQVVRVEVNQAGELVQVGVNTANADLAGALRASIPQLVQRLDQQGYESKVNMPSASTPAVPVSVTMAHSDLRSGSGGNGDAKPNSDLLSQNEPRQQRQRSPQRAWRELAAQLQEE